MLLARDDPPRAAALLDEAYELARDVGMAALLEQLELAGARRSSAPT
jgi:hypothetical protein